MIERLGLAKQSPVLGSNEIAEQIAETCGFEGTLLPAVWLCGTPIHAVVQWRQDVLAYRLATGLGPLLRRSEVRDSLGNSVPAVLNIRGFICFSPSTRARSAMLALSAYAPTTLAIAEPTDWDAWECELRDHWLVDRSVTPPVVASHGLRSRRPGTRPTAIQTRLICEQLFDVALRCELLLPNPEPSARPTGSRGSATSTRSVPEVPG